MKDRLRKGLLLIFLAAFAVSTSMLLRQFLDHRSGSAAYAEAQALAAGNPRQPAPIQSPAAAVPAVSADLPPVVWIPEPIGDDPIAEEMLQIDLAALREKNPEVLGWIRIPDSSINYPLMQGTDNDFYLNNTWDGNPNIMGSIFLECGNRPDLTDFNTIVYGHNMSTGSMFAQLHRYGEMGFWEAHPYVYILCDGGVLRYEIFAAYRAEVNSKTYGLSFRQEKTRAEFLIHALENSRIDTGIIPGPQDRILTLSTCSGAGYETRWVVQARLKTIEAI